MRTRFGFALLFALAGCAPDAAVSGVAIRDPLGLIDDVFASGNQLRLYVLPAASYSCTPTDGTVTPDVPDVAVGDVPDAIVDLSLTDATERPVEVPAGDWVVLVRGKGTDSVSGRMNVVIAVGCAQTSVDPGGTVAVPVMLAPRTDMGMCGDMLVSPDEQCETGPTSPECGPDCRTRQEVVNTTTASVQSKPRAATRSGQGVVTAWEHDGRDTGLRLFDSSARPLTGPLSIDAQLDDALTTMLAGAEAAPAVAVAPDGTIAIALTNFPPAERDVVVAFFRSSRTPLGTPVTARMNNAGFQQNAAIAYSSGGAAMVVFEDASSASGLSGRVFATGSTTPAGAEAFVVGMGRTGGTAPQIAATAAGFVVVFAAAGDVFYQRFSDAGVATDASPQQVVTDAGARQQPSVAAVADGTFLVAWSEMNAPLDLMDNGIRGRVFGADGVARGMPFTVNTTVAGDQTRPSVGASTDRFVVAFESAGAVRAMGISAAGMPSLNHEAPPAFADFVVAGAATVPSAIAVGTGATQQWWILYQAAGDGQDVFARRFPL